MIHTKIRYCFDLCMRVFVFERQRGIEVRTEQRIVEKTERTTKRKKEEGRDRKNMQIWLLPLPSSLWRKF